MVHIFETCSYLSVSVYKRAYACVCVHLHFICWIRACMTRINPCMDWGPTPAVSVAGYWQLVTDTCNMNRYQQDMFMYESAQIFQRDTNQILTGLNLFKQQKQFFSWGRRSYDINICVYIVNISFKPV